MGVGCSCLDAHQYMKLNYPTGRVVKQGPGCFPYCCAITSKHDGVTLTNKQYVMLEHLGNAEGENVVEVVSGPGFYRPNSAYTRISEKQNKVELTRKQYVRVTDALTGDRRIVEGPTMFCPGPYEKCSPVTDKLDLSNVQYVIVRNEDDGSVQTVRGPCLFTPGPYQQCSDVKDQVVLNNNEYIYITNKETGIIIVVTGPQTFALNPNDLISNKFKKIVLKQFEYIKIVDNNTGVIRVERGPSTIILQPYESKIGEVNRAHEINEHSAVLVMNTDSGVPELIQMNNNEPFMFFPSPTQEVVNVQKKIRLEQHECMVIVDKDGKYIYHRGDNETRSFFVPPYCHVLEQTWSVDLQKSKSEVLKVSRFDLRPQYMDFEFLIRTKDNVEIIIDLNFYWQIINIDKMISVTSDAPEDICKHAMSQILSEASRKDMKELLENFNEVIQAGVSKDEEFYSSRGIVIHKVEITGRKCKDPQTETIFHDIIKEKTNRIRNMEKQAGENEVHARKLEGDIELEKLEGQKLQVRKGFMREEAIADGQSEGDRITSFMSELPKELSKEEKLRIYFDQQNTSRVKSLTESRATLYVTRDDMDIKLTNIEYNGVNDHSLPVKHAKKLIG